MSTDPQPTPPKSQTTRELVEQLMLGFPEIQIRGVGVYTPPPEKTDADASPVRDEDR